MTKLTMESGIRNAADRALEDHRPDFAARPGHVLIGIAEIKRTKITTVDDGTGEDGVKLALLSFEPATGEGEHRLREAQRALYALRTAEGTLTGDMDVEVAEQTLSHLGHMLGMEEAARLKIGVRHYLAMLDEALDKPMGWPTAALDLADAVKLAAMGLHAVLAGVTEPSERASDDGTPPGVVRGSGEIVEDTGNETEPPGAETAEESGYDGPTSPDLPPAHPGYRPDGGDDGFGYDDRDGPGDD